MSRLLSPSPHLWALMQNNEMWMQFIPHSLFDFLRPGSGLVSGPVFSALFIMNEINISLAENMDNIFGRHSWTNSLLGKHTVQFFTVHGKVIGTVLVLCTIPGHGFIATTTAVDEIRPPPLQRTLHRQVLEHSPQRQTAVQSTSPSVNLRVSIWCCGWMLAFNEFPY